MISSGWKGKKQQDSDQSPDTDAGGDDKQSYSYICISHRTQWNKRKLNIKEIEEKIKMINMDDFSLMMGLKVYSLWALATSSGQAANH